MPEKAQSVQVDGGAHTKVQQLADLMGTTQRIAASLLIDVADEADAIKRHHATVLKRFSDRSRTPRPPQDGRRSTGGPDAGTPAPAAAGPGGQRPASQ